MKSLAISILLLLTFAGQAFASDHVDGPVTTSHRVADLTDFYAFPTPNKKSSLSLVLNTYPFVSKWGHFDSKAVYTFVLRKAEVKGKKEQAGFSTSDEVTVRCEFYTPKKHSQHKVTCYGSNGITAEAKYNELNSSTGDFQLFAGMRSDPFFFRVQFADALINKGEVLESKADNFMKGLNCLSIIIEVDIAKLFDGAEPELIAAATMVTTKDTPQSEERLLDRIGRPEATNVSLFTPNGKTELRDEYNARGPFEVSNANKQKYSQRISENIDHFDAIDEAKNWSDVEKANLIQLLVEDFLVIAPFKDCTGDNFLEIEKSLLLGKDYQTCGGRKVTDDIMDRMFGLYVQGMSSRGLSDSVDTPAKPISDDFPYLAEPSHGVISQTKAFIIKTLLRFL